MKLGLQIEGPTPQTHSLYYKIYHTYIQRYVTPPHVFCMKCIHTVYMQHEI